MKTGLRSRANLKGSTLMRNFILMFSVLALVAGVAAADDKPAKAAKVKVYDFTADSIEGDLVKPDGVGVDARDFTKHSSLIRIRKDFIPEIIKSAEDL